MKTNKRNRVAAAFVAGLLIAGGTGQVWAAPYTWNSTSDGNWNDGTANGWNTGGTYPNAQGDSATFSQNITAARTVTINVTDARVGALTLAHAYHEEAGWRIIGSNTLTFDVAAGSATLIVSNSGPYNPHWVSAPIASASTVPLAVTVGPRCGLLFSGNNANLTGGITVSGDGAQYTYVRFAAANSLGAAGNTVTINAGAQVAIDFDGLTLTDLARFKNSSGVLAFGNVTYDSTVRHPPTDINLTGFNEYFRLGAFDLNRGGDASTVSGVFTPPSKTYRFGGGGGKLVVASTLADGSSARSVAIGGPEYRNSVDNTPYYQPNMVALTASNSYTGPTEVRSENYVDRKFQASWCVLRLSGTHGSALNTSAFNVRPNAILQLDAGLNIKNQSDESGSIVGNNNNRVGDSTPVNLYGGSLYFFGDPPTGTSETMGNLNVLCGLARLDARWQTGFVNYENVDVFTTRGTGTGAAVLTAQQLNLSGGGQLWLRGANLGRAGSSATRVMFATAPTVIGGGGAAGSTTISIIPGVWKSAGFNAEYPSGLNQWVTYDAAVGLRALSDTANEYSTLVVGENSDNNAKYQQTGAGSILDISSATTVNSLKIQKDATSGFMQIQGTGPLKLKSGNLLIEGAGDSAIWMNVPIDCNGQAGNVFIFQGSKEIYFTSEITNTGGNGVNFTAFNYGIPNTGNYLPYIGGNQKYTGPTSVNAGSWRLAAGTDTLPKTTDLRVRMGAHLTCTTGPLTQTVASLSGAGILAGSIPDPGNELTLIVGSGTGVDKAVTLEGAGYIAPGDEGPGTLTLSEFSATDGVRLRSGELRIELNSAVSYDRLSVSATKVTIRDPDNGHAGTTLVVTLGNAPQTDDLFKIVDVGGSTAVVGKFSNGDAIQASYGGNIYAFEILYNSALGGGDGNDIVLRCTGKIPGGTVMVIR